MKKFDRKLGTSKREQGVITPKRPRDYKCGCRRINNNDGKGWVVVYKCENIKHSY